ncbi:choice-of-anchor J domain-containing protein [Flavobacterium sp. U410]
MRKITLWLLLFFISWQMNAQSTCTQTFTTEGYDNSGATLTINSADLTCYGGGTVTGIQTVNASGSLTSGFCSTNQTSWFSFLVSIDGAAGTYMCGPDFNNIDLTGFSSLTITAQDDDGWSDYVTLTLSLEATYTPVTPPSCVSLSSPLEGATVSSSIVSWPAADGGPTGYKLNAGTTPGGTDVLNMFDVGDVLSYSLGVLSPETTYYVTVIPYNTIGDRTGCSEVSFSTCGVMTVPFTEGFNSDSITKGCWSILDENGDGDAWDLNYTNNPYEGDQVAVIYTDYNSGDNDDWLISPAIALTGNQRLKFHYRVQSSGEPNDFELLLSTTGNTPADFTNTLITNTSHSNTDYEEALVNLNAYSGNVYIAWHVPSGGLDGWRLYIDNVIIEELPSCVEPENLIVSNVTPNSVRLEWGDPTGSQFDFEYLILPTGSDAPDNTTSGISVGDLTVTDSSLSPATTYDAYVRAYCSTSDQSLWVGPLTFSTPALVVCGTPVNTTYCYGNYDTTGWIFISSDGSPLRVTFNSGEIESCCDDILIYDGTDSTGTLLYQGNNGGDLSGLTFDSISDAIYIQMDTDVSVSCSSGSFSNQIDFTVFCATCINPTATFATVPNCVNNEFSIDVDLTSLGTATSVSISDGTTTLTNVATTDVYTFGPYVNSTSVSIVVSNEQDNSCYLNLNSISYSCPPANDECVNAIALTVGGVFADYPVTGINLAATASSSEIDPSGCNGYSGGDVWYTAVVPSSGSLTVETGAPSVGSGIDTVVTIYTGVCGALTEVGCDDDGGTGAYSLTELTGLTSGETVYIRVYEYANDNTGSFDLAVYDASLSNVDFSVDGFKVYPNPVKDVLNLEYSSDITEVRVINLLGQEVLKQKTNATSAQLNMAPLATGTYIVNVQLGDVVKTLKVIKE